MIGENFLVSVNDIAGQTISEPVLVEEAYSWMDNPDQSFVSIIGSLITSARRELENRYKITIAERNRELFYSDYGSELLPSHGPHSITSIESVDFDQTKTVLTANEDYSVYGSEFTMIRFPNCGKDILITTSSGYSIVPDDIKTSVLMLVKYMFDGEWDEEEKFPRDIDRIMRYYDKHVV